MYKKYNFNNKPLLCIDVHFKTRFLDPLHPRESRDGILNSTECLPN